MGHELQRVKLMHLCQMNFEPNLLALLGDKKVEANRFWDTYDLVIDLSTIENLRVGFDIYSATSLHKLYSLERESVFVAVMGNFNVGKSFLLVS
jgi:hypothetical protein